MLLMPIPVSLGLLLLKAPTKGFHSLSGSPKNNSLSPSGPPSDANPLIPIMKQVSNGSIKVTSDAHFND